MNIFGRTLIILAAAMLVCGVTLGLVNTGVVGSGGFADGQRPQGAQIAPQTGAEGQDAAWAAPQAGRRPGGPRGEGGRGGFAALELLKNLGIVAAVVLVVAPVAGWLGRRRRNRPAAQTIRL